MKTQSIFNKTKKQKKGNKKTLIDKIYHQTSIFQNLLQYFCTQIHNSLSTPFPKRIFTKNPFNQSINKTCIDFVEMSKEEKIFIEIYMLKFFAIALVGKGKNTWINLC